MLKNRLSVILSFLGFVQLMFIGFGGSFAIEIVKDQSNEAILFWSSLASLVLAIMITYLYVVAFALTNKKQQQ